MIAKLLNISATAFNAYNGNLVRREFFSVCLSLSLVFIPKMLSIFLETIRQNSRSDESKFQRNLIIEEQNKICIKSLRAKCLIKFTTFATFFKIVVTEFLFDEFDAF